MKFTLIGGGSAYAASLLGAFIANARYFDGAEIALMDIDAENLALIHTLGTKMIRAARVNLTLTHTTDRRRALEGADFVITSFRAGGYPARHLDESIPLEFGIVGNETVGPGGFFMALRTIPIIAAIAREVEELAPNAFVLNYTNPTNIVTEAITLASPKIRVIGMCDGPAGEKEHLCEIVHLDLARLQFQSIGLNHANWTTFAEYDGRDVVPLILERAQDALDNPDVSNRFKRILRLTARYQRIPSIYMENYYFHDEVLAEWKAKGKTRAQEVMEILPEVLAHYREQAAQEMPHLTKMRGSGGFGDFAVDLARALVTDSGETIILNVVNRGAIPNFPAERVVEVPCTVTRRGATPQVQTRISSEVAGLLEMLAESQHLTAQAALWGGRNDAIRALAANPLVMDIDRAAALYDAMAHAQRAWLPERL